MSAATFRKLLRWVHFICAGILGTYLYSPWSSNPIFHQWMLWIGLPLLALTGLAMWQQGKVMKWFGIGPAQRLEH